MAKERKGWEEDSAIVADVKKGSAPPPTTPGLLTEKASESSTLRGSVFGRQEEATNGQRNTANLNDREGPSRPSEGTTV